VYMCAGTLFIQHGSLYVQLDGSTEPAACVIDRAALTPAATTIVAEAGGGADASATTTATSAPPIQDVCLCERTGWIAFECGDEVYVAQATARMTPAGISTPWPAYQITAGARGVEGVHHGTADYLSAEEFSRMEGIWWSPDGQCGCQP